MNAHTWCREDVKLKIEVFRIMIKRLWGPSTAGKSIYLQQIMKKFHTSFFGLKFIIQMAMLLKNRNAVRFQKTDT